MPRYLVERTFSQGLHIPTTEEGTQVCLGVVERNADVGVTWLHSYISDDKTRAFCIYDGPNVEAIRKAGELSGLPIEQITAVRVLDPYFYR